MTAEGRRGGVIDYERLPPTQQLALETLAARHRLGESLWTFTAKTRPVLRELEDLGLAWTESPIVPRTVRAALTEQGRALMLSEDYIPPILRPVESDVTE
jgi:hypothetical protein